MAGNQTPGVTTASTCITTTTTTTTSTSSMSVSGGKGSISSETPPPVAAVAVTTIKPSSDENKTKLLQLFISKQKGQNAFCCVPMCKNSSKKNPNLHFHTFPKEDKIITSGARCGENLRKVWLCQIHRKKFKITKDTLVCSEHFNNEDYKPRTRRNKLYGQPGHSLRLYDNAYPTLFSWNNWGRRSSGTEECQMETNNNCNFEHTEVPVIDMMHNYSLPSGIDDAGTIIQDLRRQLDQAKIDSFRFSLERYSADDALVEHYTGFDSYGILTKFFHTLEEWEHASIMRSKIRVSSRTTEGLQPVSCEKGLQLIDQLVLYQMYIYRGLSVMDLAARFLVPVDTVWDIIITWADILFFFLGVMTVWPSKEEVRESLLPSSLNGFKLSDARVCLECVELRSETSASHVLKSLPYKEYKSTYTHKGLIAIIPNGTVIFVSPLMSHSLSDQDLTIKSGVLDLCEKGDAIVVDSDFKINKLCSERGIKVYHSDYKLWETSEITEDMTVFWSPIKNVMRKILENQLFLCVPSNIKETVSQMWAVACLLCNFQIQQPKTT
ncbi:uncharacterized protein LOC115209356 [Octopus sinensis]|uniref:Uncharacterized protein LOC115209356 n=1 Tax=Octopus sinensis TaxID=2607531 RepID=A0A6P7S611_9MOLL|nr:uncharacterized protein LOC115209356 [Octopus sinensis]